MTLVDRPGTGRRAGDVDASRRRRPTRRSRLVRALVLLAGLGVALVVFTFVQVRTAAGQDDRPHAGAIVVLGAAQYDGRPSPALEARLQHALALYDDGVAPIIVVTGGRRLGDRYTEATAGYNWLRERGVGDEAIRKEVEGTNTFESIASAARFLTDEGIEEVVLVSDPSHSYRLQAVAREVGLTPHVSPARPAGASRGTARALARETVAVSVGRVIGYRRLDRLMSDG